MAEGSLVSICIPTYNRPVLLKAALDSCFAQTYTDFEIVIGDDSKNDASELLVKKIQSEHPGKIRYFRNIPSLGQAGNVNSLFQNANGYRLVLLHDDDLLLPNALQDLSDCWRLAPSITAAFGKQYMMSMDGEILLDKSVDDNITLHRIEKNAGLITNPIIAGINSMFPNDGYMVLTDRARATGYRPFKEVGEACDFDFGIRLCSQASQLWFLNKYISAYRFSDDAITNSAITPPYSYRLLKELEVPKEFQAILNQSITWWTPDAVSGYARMGQGWNALRILLSTDYSLKQRLRAKFLFHCLLTFVALTAGSRGVNLVLKMLKGYVRA